MMLGAIFVLFSDIVGRIVVYPYEINIGLTIGVLEQSFSLSYL